MFGFRRVGGKLAACGLSDWWLHEFSDVERRHMEERFRSAGNQHFFEGTMSEDSAVHLLSNMAGHFAKKADAPLAARILEKAESLETGRILDRHFQYMQTINTYYRLRDEEPGAYEKAKEYCRKQIDLAPKAAAAFRREYKGGLPSHTGFMQLAIILDKEGRLDEAIDLCKTAKAQGWGQGMSKGPEDWDSRIARYEKKRDRQDGKKKRATPEKEATPATFATDPPTHFEHTCPQCGHVLRIPVQFMGQTGTCKKCGSRITLPK